MFKYQELIDNLPKEEVDLAIKKMVDNYDLTGKYFDKGENTVYSFRYGIRTFNAFFTLTPEFIIIIDKYTQRELGEELSFDFSNVSQNNVTHIKEEIYRSLLGYLESKARIISENREHLRIAIGNKVDFSKCMLHNEYMNKVEFYKDGGWGIAEKDGTVIVKNHIIKQPSKTNPLYSGSSFLKTPYRIIQDRDTNKYGVFSNESFIETIHCLYEEIKVVDYYDNSIRHFFIMTKKNEKWGCFDENCALIIDCMYDDIRLKEEYLECTREGESLLFDTLDKKGYDFIIEGKKDLYTKEGRLLLGGFDNLVVERNYILFYFGTKYEYYYVKETDYQGYSCKLSQLRLNYENSLCLIVDKEFKTIIQNEKGFYQIHKGVFINSIEELKTLVPSEFLFKNRVDLSHLNDCFIYLHNYGGEHYLIPEYIKKGYSCPEDLYSCIVPPMPPDIKGLSDNKNNPINQSFKMAGDIKIPSFFGDEDMYVEDDIVTIIRLNKSMNVAWRSYVNEIDIESPLLFIYRKGNMVGLYNEEGLGKCIFDAITSNSSGGNIYVAHYVYAEHGWKHNHNNPNYCSREDITIQYYSMDIDGNLTRMEDDWRKFDPTKYEWFPHDFINKHYDIDDDGYYDWNCGCEKSYGWTNKELRDAADSAYEGYSTLYLGLDD